MNTLDRVNRILLNACNARIGNVPLVINEIDVDTSSPGVPFGFVVMATALLNPGEMPDIFWSRCLGSDRHVDIYSARLQAQDEPVLDGIFSVIRQDLHRVGSEEAIELPVHVQESFALHDCCEFCCGSVLLIRADNKAHYIHWHRES